MFRRTLPRQQPNQPIAARTINRTAIEVERLGNLRVAAPLAMQQLADGPLIRLAGRLLESTFAKSGGSGVPALSGSSPGSATVTLYNFDGTSLTAGTTVTAYNPSTTAVGANKWLVLLKVGNYWIIVVESC